MNSSIREINVDEIAQVSGGGTLGLVLGNALHQLGDATYSASAATSSVIAAAAGVLEDLGDAAIAH